MSEPSQGPAPDPAAAAAARGAGAPPPPPSISASARAPDATLVSAGGAAGRASDGPERLAAAAALAIPDVTLTRVLGEGGMGVVYAGRQGYLERDVAVKVLAAQLTDPKFAERFRREAKILAGMTHSNIVGCYSAGVAANNSCYLVMELIDGPSLAQWLKEKGAIAPGQSLAICRDVAAALDHALQAKIIHRDVKPENVLLARKKGAPADDPFPFTVKLADLGLARSTGDDAAQMDLTQKGTVLGTPTTMAPEQFEDPDAVDWRADIYGLGCVLFHCLTGRQAFPAKATLAATFRQKLEATPPDPRQLRAGLDATVSGFAMRLLAKERAQRPQSYAEIIAECERLMAAGRAPSAAAKRGARRFALAALLVVVAAAATWWATRPRTGGTAVPPRGAPTLVVTAKVDGAAVAADDGPLAEGEVLELAATLRALPDGVLPSVSVAAVEPKEWPIETVDATSARTRLPRGLRRERFVATLTVGGVDGVAPVTREWKLARASRVDEIERALATPGSVDLLRRFPDPDFDEGVDDPNDHRALAGDHADFGAWILPRGDWKVQTAFHLMNPRQSERTAGGVRIDVDDGFGLEIRVETGDPRPDSGKEWTVAVRECRGTTTKETIDLPDVGSRWATELSLAPNHVVAASDGSTGETEMQDVLSCLIAFSAEQNAYSVALDQLREEHPQGADWGEVAQPHRRFQRKWTRGGDLKGSTDFLPTQLVLWKSRGGLCVHTLTLSR